jgi:hypothetical protein
LQMKHVIFPLTTSSYRSSLRSSPTTSSRFTGFCSLYPGVLANRPLAVAI